MNRICTQATRPSPILAIIALIVLACLSCALNAVAAPGQAHAAGSKTISSVYGVSRLELVTWLEAHEKDKYYLKTPYKPYDWRSPKGDINDWGADSDGKTAGMNCTGFVWHALCAANKWKNGIAKKLPALTGWATAIKENSLKNYTFKTKKKMLASGKLEKGDIIWMWEDGDSSKKSSLHHVAIFWGDTSSEDRMWHSAGDPNDNWKGKNAITKIKGKASTVSYQVIKLGGKLNGAISLQKTSANEAITKGNDNYSLEGAEYGVFETEAAAATHNADKAMKTFKTDANGAFTSGQEFRVGTYYVAETAAPRGYSLDEKVYSVKVAGGKTTAVNGGMVQDFPSLGAIKLVKRSTNAPITDNNRCYSLKGAVYGVFKQKGDAETHAASKAAKTYATGNDGTFTSPSEWAVGTYYIAEISPPTGYVLDKTVYTVAVKSGQTAVVNENAGSVSDTPQSNPITLWAAKHDAETADHGPQGSATLAGALFEVAYYDGYYDLASLPSAATRTWVVKSAEDGKAYARDDLKVSGDDFYRTADGHITVPLGTITIREQAAPAGYLLGDGSAKTNARQLIQIRASKAEERLGVYIAPTFSDFVKRGGVAIGKVDRQNAGFTPQGSATLEGAVFEIVSENDQQVMVMGTRYEKGQVVATVETTLCEDGRYIAQTSNDLLPTGLYSLTEVESSEGYVLDSESRSWKQTFEIEEHQQVVDLTDPTSCAANQVVRGDFGFSKVDGQTDARLGLVPFMVTSLTTGERHVIMTDENGMVSTASSWNERAKHVNSNDEAAKVDDGAEGGFSVDETKLDPRAGVWFSGRADIEVTPDPELGALPYDTYTVSELRSSANSGYELATFEVRISRHARELDLGTVDDNPGPVIGTMLADDNGVKLAAAGGITKLVDTVGYDNLDMRETYKLLGELHLVTDEGADGGVVAESTIEFTPQSSSGDVDVTFSLDTSDLGGARLVAFEKLARPDGTVIASHEDISDEGQTVRVPSIATTLVDELDADHEAAADEAITFVDTVSYRGLTPGVSYRMSAELHIRGEEGADEGLALDNAGRPITSSRAFTPEKAEGQVDVRFSFAAPNLADKTVVAFEELVRNDRTYAAHADISDNEQAIWFSPAHPEEGEVPDFTTEIPEEKTEAPKTMKGSVVEHPEKRTLPRTGDALDPRPFAIAAIAAASLLTSAVCIRRRKRRYELELYRSLHHRR